MEILHGWPNLFAYYYRPSLSSSSSSSSSLLLLLLLLFYYTLSSHTIAKFYGKRFSNSTYAVKTINIILPQEKLNWPKNISSLFIIALMHVYVTQANFTTKPRFEIKNKRSFTEMNSQGSRVEKNTHAQKVQMQKILFTNEACWWNLLFWRNHA